MSKNIKSLLFVFVAVAGLGLSQLACSNDPVADVNVAIGTELENGCTASGGTVQETPLGKICHSK